MNSCSDYAAEPCYSSDNGLNANAQGLKRLSARKAEIGGGIAVARLLPSQARRTIGAWCFLDHAGPATFPSGSGLRVGPHPHTGLQTFTWMLDGEVLHRDSLGNEQLIRPGQVNLMTAGHGISHTEESPAVETRAHAAQLWIALPATHANSAPAFTHYPHLPCWRPHRSCTFTLLAGGYDDLQAPVTTYTPLVGLDLLAEQNTELTLSLNPVFEYGLLPLTGTAILAGESFAADELAYLAPGHDRFVVKLAADTRALLIGGEPFGENITIWWNFVGPNKEYVAQARNDWATSNPRFGQVHGFDGPRLTAPAVPWETS